MDNRPFRPMANLVGEAINETVNIGNAFSAAPVGLKQSRYDAVRRLLQRGVRVLDYEIISRDGLSEGEQTRLLADLWAGKPVVGFP